MLKLLAALLMLLDHLGYYLADFLPGGVVVAFRTAGRLSFPIFAWLIACGFVRTRHPVRYFTRMTLFSAVSELIIRFAHKLAGFPTQGTNVLITFALSLVLLSGYRLASRSYLDMIASLRPVTTLPGPNHRDLRYDVRLNPGGIELNPKIGLPVGIFMMLVAAACALIIKPDYGLYGLLAVLLFYIGRDRYEEQIRQSKTTKLFIILNATFLVVRIFLLNWPLDWAIMQCFSIFAIPICYRLDREKRPPLIFKYFFYFFYAGHILLICLFRYWLLNNNV